MFAMLEMIDLRERMSPHPNYVHEEKYVEALFKFHSGPHRPLAVDVELPISH